MMHSPIGENREWVDGWVGGWGQGEGGGTIGM